MFSLGWIKRFVVFGVIIMVGLVIMGVDVGGGIVGLFKSNRWIKLYLLLLSFKKVLIFSCKFLVFFFFKWNDY